ncbi:hypothetical protein [Bordetella bronchialis]|uniref:CR-type domain-containing protein n=1 Tax=Bordetella bronchialis TaxID=463025 RepID=A0A193FU85_9BORD|nr:hypothetical protein [Bordetella bronchialis]ANN70893.1 hypothetical protein BAU08_05705 [Bordetella bronchialis]
MTIDIQRFCAQQDDAREWLHKPWLEDCNTVATNGHIAIVLRTPIVGAVNAEPGPGMRGAVQRLIDQTAGHHLHAALNDVRIVKYDCPYCQGGGFVSCEKCKPCGGEGEFKDADGWHICEECEGDGILTLPRQATDPDAQRCYSCCGTGHEWRSSTMVSHVNLANRYLSMLQDLPNCVLALPSDPDQAVRFDFDGGTGVLMPMRV